ncbi:MAG: hypothetical protein F4Z65_06935 [Acidobacteria bacterium]|nr:hypothetical protein [Acidobacteriota bacterium]MYA45527.1 hypothetical protein [Acidobacteriota bacterium]MYI38254.1 hypothetical protein [Acidobacteriota bacterium]
MAGVSGGRLVPSGCAFLLAFALATGIVTAAPAWPQDLSREAGKGRNLSAAEAAVLERRLLDNPQDLTARAQLVGYYHAGRRANPRRHTEHVLWFIRNAPESEVLDSRPARVSPMFDADGYLEAKRTWQRLVREEPDNVAILRHAAGFHAPSERAFAAGLLQRAEDLEPSNPEWARELAELEWREARRFPEGRDPAGAARALVHFERAHDLSGAADRVDLLPDLALAAFAAGEHQKARTHALAMLDAGPNRRDRGDLLHYGNLVLGHLALGENDLEEARTRLLATGRTGRLPIERSGGPDMSLAEALLQRGESATVLQYLELCLDFWPEGEERLLDWIVLVEAGLVPDFRPLAF